VDESMREQHAAETASENVNVEPFSAA